MNTVVTELFETKTEEEWLTALESLLPDIHEVDRNAVQVWFRFYPLKVRRYIESAEDKEEVKRQLQLLGDYDLAEQIDTSHRFLYGHRFWPKVKQAIEALSEPPASAGGQKGSPNSTSSPPANAGGSDSNLSIADLARELSMEVSER